MSRSHSIPEICQKEAQFFFFFLNCAAITGFQVRCNASAIADHVLIVLPWHHQGFRGRIYIPRCTIKSWGQVPGEFSLAHCTTNRDTKKQYRKSSFKTNYCILVFCIHGAFKITEKVSFNIASEARYVNILSGQKLTKNVKDAPFCRVFENLKLAVKQCYQISQF